MTIKPTQSATSNERSRLTQGGADTPDELAIAALVARLPSASPDDLSVERVWRRVMAPEVRRPRARLLWIPAVALVAVLMLTLVRRGSSTSAELALSSGGVFSGKLAEQWRASQSGEVLAEAERVRTEATGRAVLRIDGVAAVLLRGETDLGLEKLHHGTVVRLSRGVLTARVSKRSPDEPFVVETDRYSVKVVGTLFTVEQGPGDHTGVSVREGVVDVSDGQGHAYRVVAGQRWDSESRDIRTPDHTPDSVKALLEDGLAGKSPLDLMGPFVQLDRPTEAPPAPPVIAPRIAPDVRGVAPSTGLPGNGAEHSSLDQAQRALVPPQAPAIDSFGAPVVDVARTEDTQPIAPASSAIVPAVPPTLSASPAASAAAPVDDGPYARGLALEAKGNFEGAARELSRAADEDPLHGDIATYALGRLAQRRLHDATRARAAFDRYRERYPHGALMPEVDLAILELEVDGHSQTEALADSTRFLAAHPGSERVDEVRLLRGNLLRDAGRCREALDEYALVRLAPFSDHAVYSTAYCQQKLGDRLAAAATLRDYLTRFPGGAHRAEAQRALEDD